MGSNRMGLQVKASICILTQDATTFLCIGNERILQWTGHLQISMVTSSLTIGRGKVTECIRKLHATTMMIFRCSSMAVVEFTRMTSNIKERIITLQADKETLSSSRITQFSQWEIMNVEITTAPSTFSYTRPKRIKVLTLPQGSRTTHLAVKCRNGIRNPTTPRSNNIQPWNIVSSFFLSKEKM